MSSHILFSVCMLHVCPYGSQWMSCLAWGDWSFVAKCRFDLRCMLCDSGGYERPVVPVAQDGAAGSASCRRRSYRSSCRRPHMTSWC